MGNNMNDFIMEAEGHLTRAQNAIGKNAAKKYGFSHASCRDNTYGGTGGNYPELNKM